MMKRQEWNEAIAKFKQCLRKCKEVPTMGNDEDRSKSNKFKMDYNEMCELKAVFFQKVAKCYYEL